VVVGTLELVRVALMRQVVERDQLGHVSFPAGFEH
jgi:hypothetical protein